jgi:carbohydrate kinase (thermoresistant glucokinase family)
MIVVVMGVSGAGKTTVGNALAESLGWEFLDADDFHPDANVAKMASGRPLEDADRWPWLERLNAELIAREAKGADAVLACSALKEAYRRKLMANLRAARLVHLLGGFDAISARVQERRHKYMPASLLQSQFDTLEPPANALAVDATLDIPEAVRRIAADLATRGPARTP